MKKPRISIGMPVYNGEKTIIKSIESILCQTYENFEFIISDNNSSDSTSEICKKYAEKDSRIKYIKQSHNIGAEANFSFVLTQATSEYFMWAASDDIRSIDFLEININFLEKNKDFIGSTSPTRFESNEFNPIVMGDECRCEDNQYDRILRFFGHWHANGRFYSLFRRESLIDCFETKSYLGADWGTVINLLKKGKINRANKGFVELGKHGASRSYYLFRLYRNKPIHWAIPFLELSVHTLKIVRDSPLKIKKEIIKHLIKINIRAVAAQVIYEYRIRKYIKSSCQK